MWNISRSHTHTFFLRVTTHGGGNMSSVDEAEAEEDRRAGWDLRWAAPVTAAMAGAAAPEGDSAEPGGQGEPGMDVAASPSEAESEIKPKLDVGQYLVTIPFFKIFTLSCKWHIKLSSRKRDDKIDEK